MHISRRVFLGASAAGAALIVAGCQTQSPDLNAILDQAATDFLRESPEYATMLAVSEEQAGGPYLSRVSDVSRAGLARTREVGQRTLEALERVDRASLSAQDQVSLDVVTTSLRNSAASAAFPTGGGANSPYTVSQLSGAYLEYPDFLASRHPVTDRAGAEAYVERLAGFARILDQETTRIAEDEADGVIQPDFTIDGAVRQLRLAAGVAPAQNTMLLALQGKLGALADVPETDRTALLTRAEAIIANEINPALTRQAEALTALRPRSVHDAGIWRLPRGEEMYAAGLRDWTTSDYNPQQIHDMGVELVTQFRSEMEAIFNANGMTRGTLNERVRALSSRPDQIWPSTEAGRTALLASLNQQMAAITARMPELCNRLTSAPLEIRRVPVEIEAGSPGGYYQPPALDGSRPGAYYINLRDPAKEWPKFSLPTLTYHEGTPGHHWQIALQQEAGDMPFYRRALMFFSGFMEGWGLYAEQIADEIGMYQNDPWGRVGYLQSMIFRASRLVVDTGMHSLRWSREDAIRSMMDATGDAETTITTEIERYAVWPGQACAYMVGRQAINQMREGARATLQQNFDIRGFHDTLLANGAVPLNVAAQLVETWAAGVSGPA